MRFWGKKRQKMTKKCKGFVKSVNNFFLEKFFRKNVKIFRTSLFLVQGARVFIYIKYITFHILKHH
jgi:hypothetical protein